MINSLKEKYLRIDKLVYFAFFSAVLIFSLIFFTQTNPIIVFDADDWLFASFTRPAIPLTGGYWNPSRVLPEITTGLCSAVGYHIFNPFLNDPLASLTVAYAVIVSVFILIYFYRFASLIRARFELSRYVVILVSALFFLLHFWAFRSGEYNNDYFFRTVDATCYFFYIIPNLICASFVMWFIEKKDIIREKLSNKVYLGFFSLALYLTVFSNLFPSVILVSYFSFIILKEFLSQLKSKSFSLKRLIKYDSVASAGIILWAVSAVFEFFGTRAESKSDVSFNPIATAGDFFSFVGAKINLLYAAATVAVIAVALIVALVNRGKNQNSADYLKLLGFFGYGLLISFVFIILLCAKVGEGYIVRTEIIFSIFFCIFMLTVISVIFLIRNYKYFVAALPILLVVVVSMTFLGPRTFRQSNVEDFEQHTCIEINNYLIKQFKDAEAKHLSEFELHVPVYSDETNWPHAPEYLGDRIARTMYEYHIVNTLMEVKVVPDIKVNEKFGIDFSGEEDEDFLNRLKNTVAIR